MRRSFSLLVTLMLCAVCSYAQLKVNQSGDVSIMRSDSLQNATLAVGVKDNSISYPTNPFAGHVLDLSCHYGILSYASLKEQLIDGKVVGVCGIAGNAPDGYNFGVIGALSKRQNGAGVFGTLYNTSGIYMDKRYAGYFDGEVKVAGDLNVTGLINGVMLGDSWILPTPLKNTTLQKSSAEENVTDKLLGLQAYPYCKSQAKKSFSNIREDMSEVPVSFLAEQINSKTHYALSATELEEVFPDLVYEREDGIKYINYIGMIPLLVQSISELNMRINKMEGASEGLKKVITAGLSDNVISKIDASLAQNYPNPFVDITHIEVNIPTTISSAKLCIYDMNGKQVKQISLSERGKFTVKVSGNELGAGMFLYSLIVDNNIVDTKRMVLTKS